MKLKIVLFIFISLFIISCSDNGTDPYNPEKEIWPLAVGNSWTYYIYSYRSSTKIMEGPSDTLIYYISSKVIVDGKEWFVLSAEGAAQAMVQNRKDGFWGYYIGDFTGLNKNIGSLRFKYPTKIDDRFMTEHCEIKTLNKNVEIKSDAGTFKCISYIDCDQPISDCWSYYVAPGIGMVRREGVTTITNWESPVDTIWIRQELVSYHINKF